jgi:hypothetical protein
MVLSLLLIGCSRGPSNSEIDETVKSWWSNYKKDALEFIIYEDNIIKKVKNMPDIYSDRKINVRKVEVVNKGEYDDGAMDITIKVEVEIPVCKVISHGTFETKTENMGTEILTMQNKYYFMKNSYGKWDIYLIDKRKIKDHVD